MTETKMLGVHLNPILNGVIAYSYNFFSDFSSEFYIELYGTKNVFLDLVCINIESHLKINEQ